MRNAIIQEMGNESRKMDRFLARPNNISSGGYSWHLSNDSFHNSLLEKHMGHDLTIDKPKLKDLDEWFKSNGEGSELDDALRMRGITWANLSYEKKLSMYEVAHPKKSNNIKRNNKFMKEEDALANRPFAEKYFKEWAIAFVWHARRQRWRIVHLRKEMAQLEHSNQLLVQHNYVLMKQVVGLEGALKEINKKSSEYQDNK